MRRTVKRALNEGHAAYAKALREIKALNPALSHREAIHIYKCGRGFAEGGMPWADVMKQCGVPLLAGGVGLAPDETLVGMPIIPRRPAPTLPPGSPPEAATVWATPEAMRDHAAHRVKELEAHLVDLHDAIKVANDERDRWLLLAVVSLPEPLGAAANNPDNDAQLDVTPNITACR